VQVALATPANDCSMSRSADRCWSTGYATHRVQLTFCRRSQQGVRRCLVRQRVRRTSSYFISGEQAFALSDPINDARGYRLCRRLVTITRPGSPALGA
jgi:hypothetical protein